MHAVDHGGALGLQRLGGGELAWIMNSSISRCASRRSGVTTLDAALLVEQDLALGQIEVERLALGAAQRQRLA